MHDFSLLDFVTHENPTVSTLFRKKEVNARLDENWKAQVNRFKKVDIFREKQISTKIKKD